MKHLQDNWLTEGIIDFEYKKYLLLAYLKSSKEYLERQLLYPTFSDLIFHYNNLLALRDGQQSMRQQFPKELEKADLETFELTYKHKVTDGDNMQVISEVLQIK